MDLVVRKPISNYTPQRHLILYDLADHGSVPVRSSVPIERDNAPQALHDRVNLAHGAPRQCSKDISNNCCRSVGTLLAKHQHTAAVPDFGIDVNNQLLQNRPTSVGIVDAVLIIVHVKKLSLTPS